MAKKRRKASLPRLMLLAYSRRDLVAFTEAVEVLRHQVDDLRQLVEQLQRDQAGRKARTRKATSATASNGAGQGGSDAS